MKKNIKFLMLALVTMLIIMTVAFITMLFSSGDDGLRTTLFDALYFESTTLSNGNVEMNFGIYDNFVLVIISGTLLITLLIIITDAIYIKLLNYKTALENEKNL